jgi:hypothetical protein
MPVDSLFPNLPELKAAVVLGRVLTKGRMSAFRVKQKSLLDQSIATGINGTESIELSFI